jgi:iron complex outermembrane receptor protein
VNHTFDLASGASVKVRAFTKYSSSYVLSDFVNAKQYTQKAFTRSDATLTYSAPNDTYFVQAFVQNIEDKVQAVGSPNYNDAALAGNLNAAWIYVSTPRLWGVRLGINFH